MKSSGVSEGAKGLKGPCFRSCTRRMFENKYGWACAFVPEKYGSKYGSRLLLMVAGEETERAIEKQGCLVAKNGWFRNPATAQGPSLRKGEAATKPLSGLPTSGWALWRPGCFHGNSLRTVWLDQLSPVTQGIRVTQAAFRTA